MKILLVVPRYSYTRSPGRSYRFPQAPACSASALRERPA